MTKEEAWIMWMNESKHYVEYDLDTIKKSSHWESFSRGWDAAVININGWDDAYKMGMEAGKELAQREWQGLTMEETELLIREAAKFRKGYINADFLNFAKLVAEVEQLLKEKNS